MDTTLARYFLLPAFYLGIAVATGVWSAFKGFYFLLPLGALPLCIPKKEACLAILFGLLAFFSTSFRHPIPILPEEGWRGYLQISPERLSYQTSSRGGKWIYRGEIEGFWHLDDAKPEPSLKGCRFYLPLQDKGEAHPAANSSYLIRCRILPLPERLILVKEAEKSSWEKTSGFNSLAELRFIAKRKVNQFIEMKFSSAPVRSFLSGLVTGEFHDKELSTSFQELGLIHLLAISGFHFSLLASILKLFLKPFAPERYLPPLLGSILSLYFLFLGWGPSVLRAWMTILLVYFAAYAERFSSPLNTLGCALILSLLIDPQLILNIGFQFSFLTTLAILLFQKPCQEQINLLFPPYSLQEIGNFSLPSQQGYLFLRFLLQNLSLGIATTIFALPMSLWIFGYFPLLSPFYNLFFPFLVSLSMTLLIAGLFATPIPPLSDAIHLCNDYFTSFILNLTC